MTCNNSLMSTIIAKHGCRESWDNNFNDMLLAESDVVSLLERVIELEHGLLTFRISHMPYVQVIEQINTLFKPTLESDSHETPNLKRWYYYQWRYLYGQQSQHC